jgi:4-azaleucine resistance transporter AzlC
MQHSDTLRAFRYSFPVLLGYLAIGTAFGLMMVEAGYPWWLCFLMSIIMYAGAGQYAAVGFFAAGMSLPEVMLYQFVINARHIAYSITMRKRFNTVQNRLVRWYCIFALTDETFALLSSLPPEDSTGEHGGNYMGKVALFDHCYWITGSVIGYFAGKIIPFDFAGVDFALTALFIVLLIEQIYRVKRAMPFVISGLLAIVAVIFLPERVSLLSALVIALTVVQIYDVFGKRTHEPHEEEARV